MWVSHAERPLRIDELRHALAVETDSTDLDPDNIPPQETVIGSCLGLPVVKQETSIVRLIHYTLQEYLSRPGVLPGAHRTLGETCLTYLNYAQVKALPVDDIPNLGGMPFLRYSSLCWGGHAKMELSDRAKSLALELLNRYDGHISASLLFHKIKLSNRAKSLALELLNRYDGHIYTSLLFHKIELSDHARLLALELLNQCGGHISDSLLFYKMHPGYSISLPHPLFTGLHCACYFGIDEAVAALIEMGGYDLNQADSMGYTPLIWASRQGNQGVVRLLFTYDDVDPEGPGLYGETPLSAASSQGRECVIGLLLARDDVDPDKPDNNGHTPLWWASFYGHEGAVRLLLARDGVDPDKPDVPNLTPLIAASCRGHEGVMRLLLARNDVDPDKPDNSGQTPLWWASYNGHEGVVRLLLARDDVNPDRSNNDGKTPLVIASNHGHMGVVELLRPRTATIPSTDYA